MLSVSCTPWSRRRPECCRNYDSLFAGFVNSRLTTRGDRRGLVINHSSDYYWHGGALHLPGKVSHSTLIRVVT